MNKMKRISIATLAALLIAAPPAMAEMTCRQWVHALAHNTTDLDHLVRSGQLAELHLRAMVLDALARNAETQCAAELGPNAPK